ncbi:MAG: hypothetical protein HYR91_02980 [Flavobacteriia bacterium]|nr:hypothetical protein [Flavobacteriia bacterium]
MEQQLDFGNCYYRPSFFKMKIDLPIDLSNLNEIEDGAFGLYLHEYIHFIQDISTIYGLMNISTINYYIQYCANKIFVDNVPNFNVPIEVVPKIEKENFGHLNLKLRPIYIGSPIKQKSKSISHFSFDITNYEFEKDKIVNVIKIKFKDVETDEIRVLDFGGNHVTEGMAYLCEQYHHKGILPDGEAYPYKIIEEIVKLEYPEIFDDKYFLIMICDMSLMSYHPGLSFIRLLRFFKENNVHDSEQDVADIYKLGLEEIKGNHVDFTFLIEVVRKEIKKNFNADCYKPIRDWIDTVFDRIKMFRTEVPGFIGDIIHFGKPKQNEFFAFFLNMIGSPLVLNSDDDASILLPSDFNPPKENFSPAIFWAINQVLRVFTRTDHSACELQQFCKNSKIDNVNIKVDENCQTSPWVKAKIDPLCPFGQIWRHWALSDFSPIYDK